MAYRKTTERRSRWGIYLALCGWIIGCGSVVNVAQDTGTGGTSTGTGQGGDGQGGDGQGGDGQGGDGQGGLGQGGDGQGGLGQGGTGDKPPPWCDDASECQLHSDCCECVGEHVDLPEDECLANCFVPMCEGLQAPMNPLCEAGRCVVGYDCTTTVICLLPEPVCPAGQVPRIKDNCYQGCVPADQCQFVRNCDACTSDQLCVREPDKVGGYHCVPVPDGCSGAVGDCACAGDLACDPGETCVDVGPQNQIRCDP